jgi:hypothetical protein
MGEPATPAPPGRARPARALPLIVLVLLASVFGETIAVPSTPWFLYLVAPLTLPLYVVVYGLPALLLRELWVRRWLGWAGVVAAGVGYTAFNEGTLNHTWFAAHAFGFTALQLGRWEGVNWCAVVALSTYHTVYSLGLPNAIVALVFPTRAAAPWVRGWAMPLLLVPVELLILAIVLSPSRDGLHPYHVAAACIAQLAVISPLLPRWRGLPRPRGVGVAGAYLAGLGWSILYFADWGLGGGLIGIANCGPLCAVLGLGLVGAVSLSRHPDWERRRALWLIAGLLTPGTLWNAADLPVLQAAVAVAVVVTVVLADRRLRARTGLAGSTSTA